MPEDIAILVIHGIGQQRAYETLDQFTQGLEKTFSAAGLEPRLEVCQDPLREQKQWVRADCVMTLPGGTTFASDQSSPGATIGSISFFEYYWAPVTQDKVTYRGSLWFLIQAGLTPFKYLATNITVLSATNRRKRIPLVILKELWRQAALFLPLLAFFALLLAFLTQYSNPHALLRLYRQVPAISKVLATILVIRYLYLWTAAKALLESLRGRNTWQSSWWWRLALGAGLLVHIVLWPLWISAALRGIAWLGTEVAHWMPILPRILGHWSGLLRDLAGWTQPAFEGGWPFVKDLVFLKPSFSHYSYLWVVAFAVLAYWVRFILVDYVGDLAVYTNTSELARNFAARAQIQDECAGVMSQILRRRRDRDDPTSQYVFDRVLIAAHSLGSVIAYDTINEVLNRCRASVATDPKALQPEDLRKLCGLVTFGCPLNKIFYFFREKMPPDQELRRQILDLLRGFRLVDVLRSYPPDAPGPGGPMSRNPDPRWAQAEQHLDSSFRWINAWAPADPVSGRLAFHDLQGDANQKRFNYGPWNFGRAHNMYWRDEDFYEFIRQRLL